MKILFHFIRIPRNLKGAVMVAILVFENKVAFFTHSFFLF